MSRSSEATKIAVLATNVEYIREQVDKINENIEKNYVRNDRFETVARLVYGACTLVLVSFVGGIVSLVVRGGK